MTTSTTDATASRRERNKQEKLDRIIAAADELFATHDVDDVTTLQIAQQAGIGTGTLFLYVASKAELLFLVQNVRYAAAVESGRRASTLVDDLPAALMAFSRPLVRCNRRQVDNGRHYLRELLFGPPDEPYRTEGAAIAVTAIDTIAEMFRRLGGFSPEQAATRARMMSNITLIALIEATHDDVPDEAILASIADQIPVVTAR